MRGILVGRAVLLLCVVLRGDVTSSPTRKQPRTEREVCVLDGVALVGADLPKSENGGGIVTSSSIECLGRCLSTVNCHFYTYVSIWEINCFLKNEEGGLQREFEASITGWVSDSCGFLGDEPIVPQIEVESLDKLGCAYDDYVFLGKDVLEDEGGNGIEASSFEECGVKCSQIDKCVAWNFVKAWKINCYFKSDGSVKTPMEGAIAGTLSSCKLASQHSSSSARLELLDGVTDGCRFPDVNFLGGDLDTSDEGQGIEVADADACSEKCKGKSSCNYWTFVSKWKVNCYLKSRLGENAEFEGGISGTFGNNCDLNKAPDLTPKTDGTGCRFPGINFRGGDLSKENGGEGIIVGDADGCKRECSSRRLCQFWTFVEQWEVNCYLKQSKGPEQSSEEATSGTLSIPCNEVALAETIQESGKPRSSDELCRYQDIRYLGGDLDVSLNGMGISTSSDEECEMECIKQPTCWYWTRIMEWKVDCYLKTDQATSQTKLDAVSGTVGRPCTDGGTPVKTSVALTEGSISSASTKCVYPGLSYQGGDLPSVDGGNGLITANFAECAEECSKRPNLCQYWTYVEEWKVNCYLKVAFSSKNEEEKATSGSIGLACDDTAVEASKPVLARNFGSTKIPRTPQRDVNGVCFFTNVGIRGRELSTRSRNKTSDSSNCAVQCYHTKDCEYWMHDSQNNCLLTASFEEEFASPGSTSGSIGYSCQ